MVKRDGRRPRRRLRGVLLQQQFTTAKEEEDDDDYDEDRWLHRRGDTTHTSRRHGAENEKKEGTW